MLISTLCQLYSKLFQMRQTWVKLVEENGLIAQRMRHPFSQMHPRWLSRRYSQKVARRQPAGSVAALVCWKRVPRCPSKSTLVASTTATQSPPLTMFIPASRTPLLPFGGDLRGASCVASSIFLPHLCTKGDQVHSLVSRGNPKKRRKARRDSRTFASAINRKWYRKLRIRQINRL